MAEIVVLDPQRRPARHDAPRRAREPLWREALGARLRAERVVGRATLGEVAARAGVSPQYLSEIERGLKDASSEMVAAVAGALGLALLDLVRAVAADLGASSARALTSGDPARAATTHDLGGPVALAA